MEKAFSKKWMLAAGILAMLVILCSQAFQKEACSFLSKAHPDKTEKSAEPDTKIIVATPSDAVTSSQAVEVGDANPSLIREIIFGEGNSTSQPPVDKTIAVDFLKTLLQVVISPQAP